jgi:hypothetical protein
MPLVATITTLPSSSTAVYTVIQPSTTRVTNSNNTPQGYTDESSQDLLPGLFVLKQELERQIKLYSKAISIQSLTAGLALFFETPFGLLKTLASGRFGPFAFAVTSLIEFIDAISLAISAQLNIKKLRHILNKELLPLIDKIQTDPSNLNLSSKQLSMIEALRTGDLSSLFKQAKGGFFANFANNLISYSQLLAGGLITLAAYFKFARGGSTCKGEGPQMFRSFENSGLTNKLKAFAAQFNKFEHKVNSVIGKSLKIPANNVHSFELFMAGSMLVTGLTKLKMASGIINPPFKQAFQIEGSANFVCMLEALAQIFAKLGPVYAVYAPVSLFYNGYAGLTSNQQQQTKN